MFGRSRVVLVETSICRSRESARGLKTPARAGRRGSSRRSRTSMSTCRDRARRPAGEELRTGARKVLAPSFPGGRRPEPAEAGRIDVQPGKAGSAKGRARALARAPHPIAEEASEVRAAAYRAAEKAVRARCAARERSRDSHSGRSRRRAVKHGAAGGRMTARWSGARANEGGDARFARISKQNAGGFSHGARRAVSGERVLRRVLVSERRL
jgi:hypothetical protein